MPDGHAEPHLAARQIFLRYQILEHPLQQILGSQSAQLELFGQACSEFHQMMVQKGRARFQRHGHAGDVHLHQQIIRQISHCVSQQRCINDSSAVRLCEPRLQNVCRMPASDRLFESLGIQVGLGTFSKRAYPAQITVDRSHRCCCRETLGATKQDRALAGDRAEHIADDAFTNYGRHRGISLREVHRRVPLVTCEALIAAIAVEGHGYVLPSLSRHVVAWNCRRIGERLAIVFDQRRQNFHRIRADDEFMMVSANAFRHPPRMMQLTEVLFVETDRESLNPLG